MAATDIEMARVDERKGGPPEETDYKPFNWKKFYFTPKYIPLHLLAIAIIIFTVFVTIHHDQVVEKLRPFSEKLRDLPAGFLIPIVILFIISFPPLFGHEIIAVLCGVVWGLWIGFVIVAIGTFLGEVGTWFAFKYTLRRRAEKLERSNLNYGALARLTRDGGFWIVLLIRLSAVPAHFSTAVFSTCNVKFWHFAIATVLSLPKQIFLVYVGVLLVKRNPSNRVQSISFAIVFIVSLVMGVYIWIKMKKIKKMLLDEQAQRRELRLREEMEEADKEAAERSRNAVQDPAPSWPGQQREREGLGWDTHRMQSSSPEGREWGAMQHAPPMQEGRPF